MIDHAAVDCIELARLCERDHTLRDGDEARWRAAMREIIPVQAQAAVSATHEQRSVIFKPRFELRDRVR